MAVRLKEETKHDSLVDLHVYIVPLDLWIDKYRKARNTAVLESLSAGFIRVPPSMCLHFVRDSIVDQIGQELIPETYIFLRSVGRCLAVVNRTQELVMTAGDFMQPSSHCELLLLPKTKDYDEDLENQSHFFPLNKESLSPKYSTLVKTVPKKFSNASLRQFQNGGESTPADEQNYVHFSLSPSRAPPQQQEAFEHALITPSQLYQNLEYTVDSSSSDDDDTMLENNLLRSIENNTQKQKQQQQQTYEENDYVSETSGYTGHMSVVKLADETADQQEIRARILERFEKESKRLDGGEGDNDEPNEKEEEEDDDDSSDVYSDVDLTKKIEVLSQFEIKNELMNSENTFVQENIVETKNPYVDTNMKHAEEGPDLVQHSLPDVVQKKKYDSVQQPPPESNFRQLKETVAFQDPMIEPKTQSPMIRTEDGINTNENELEQEIQETTEQFEGNIAETTVSDTDEMNVKEDKSSSKTVNFTDNNVPTEPLDTPHQKKSARLETKREPRYLKNEPKNVTISSITTEVRRKPKDTPDNEEMRKLKAVQIEDLKRQIALTKAERETNEKSLRTYAKKRGETIRENNERLLNENKAWKQKYLVEKEQTTHLQYEIEKVKKTIERQYQKSIPLPNSTKDMTVVRKNKNGGMKVEAPSEKSNQRNLVLKLQNEINELSVRHEIIKKQLAEEATLKSFAEQELKDLRFNGHKGKRNLKKSLNGGTHSV